MDLLSMPIEPLSYYWGVELASNAAKYHNAELSELMTPVVASRCGGNPFYISAVNNPEDIPMPWSVIFVNHRVDLGLGKGKEIDILASVGGDMWVCQSKWVTTRKINEEPLHELIVQAEAVRRDNEVEIPELRMWLFAHEGLTQSAEKFAREQGILWSTRSQLDELLAYLGLCQLPDIDELEVEASQS
ncbi:hypothetical protein KFU94_67525 [Chloroflexi bacterium TSY]|nr:hypothetical protein [Chloroflexi bacterium TSY]